MGWFGIADRWFEACLQRSSDASLRAAQAHCLPPRPATLPAETDLVREYDPELHAPYLTLPDQRWVHGRTHNGSRRRVTVEQKGLLRRCRRCSTGWRGAVPSS